MEGVPTTESQRLRKASVQMEREQPYVEALNRNVKCVEQRKEESQFIPKMKPIQSNICFEVNDEVIENSGKMYVGYAKQSCTTHMIQAWFSLQGVYSVKATPMGANMHGPVGRHRGSYIESLLQGAKGL